MSGGLVLPSLAFNTSIHVAEVLACSCLRALAKSVHGALQEWLPSRDNVIFLIDAQAAMFQSAGLTDVPVRGRRPSCCHYAHL